VNAESFAKGTLKSNMRLTHVDDPTTEKAQCFVIEMRAREQQVHLEMQNEDLCA